MNSPGLPFAAKLPKARRCRNKECRSSFVPTRPLQTVCGPICAQVLIEQRKAIQQTRADKGIRRETKAKLAALRTRAWYFKRAATAIRAFVRARDEGKECISCPTILIKRGSPGGDYDCGHYRGTGRAKHLELVEINQNGQCKHCNRDQHGSYHEQRPKMIARYGLEAVESLEADQEPRKPSIADLVSIAALYRLKLKELTHG